MHSSKTNGNGACCTCEQEMTYAVHVEEQKAKRSFGTFEDKIVHASLYTIDWRKFYVHRHRGRGFTKFDRM